MSELNCILFYRRFAGQNLEKFFCQQLVGNQFERCKLPQRTQLYPNWRGAARVLLMHWQVLLKNENGK